MHSYVLANSLRIGADALRANLLRTVLSTLGVIIGVAALVAVLSLGDGMEHMARTQIERFTDVQTVSVSPKTTEQYDGQSFPIRDYPVFTPNDARDAATLAGTQAMSLMVQTRVIVDLPQTGKRRMTQVAGVLSRADEFHHLIFAEGRFFTDAEAQHGSLVAILSHKLAAELAAGRDAERVVGRTVRINGRPVEVIGVLEAFEGEIGYEAWVPFMAAPALFPPSATPRPSTIMLRATSLEGVDALRSRAEDWVAERFGAKRTRVEVQTSKARLAQAAQGILIFKLFMGAITGISLLVGGIGIMNVLLASVTERTREIGVRKAVGARGRDILMQFLAESVAISGAGSAIGVGLGLASSFGVTAIIRATAKAPLFGASFSWSTIVVAAASAVTVGLVAGTYPARRAARLSPIDAIRHE